MKTVLIRNAIGMIAVFATTAFSYAVPVAQLSPTDPGLNIEFPFVGPDAFGNTNPLLPTQWGGYITGAAVTISDDGRLVDSGDNAYVRYNTTMQGVNPAPNQYTKTAMDITKDWVLSMEWESDMQETLGTVFEASAILQDVARFRVTSPGAYELQGGDGGGPYASIKTFPAGYLQPNTVYTLTLHYKASNQLMDFYINNTLEAVDFPAPGTEPDHAVDFLQLGGGALTAVPGLNYFDNIQIGLLGTAAHPGDFNGDGNVDGADFVAWQTHFPTASGASLADGDANGDGAVDGADFVIWQTSFPYPESSPGVSPVPEPNAIALAVLSAFGLLFVQHRRASAN
ncbi:MAG: dockerin type I repeat-containing protein [Pirellulales bacterium]|nr:dockerin type I repeat-containing protein [Pirellulales bacterium]